MGMGSTINGAGNGRSIGTLTGVAIAELAKAVVRVSTRTAAVMKAGTVQSSAADGRATSSDSSSNRNRNLNGNCG